MLHKNVDCRFTNIFESFFIAFVKSSISALNTSVYFAFAPLPCFSPNISKSLNRNNHNPSKLEEKYNNLAREALANEDKILSESYFQYADHFTRVLSEREKNQSIKEIKNSDVNKSPVSSEEKNKELGEKNSSS